MRRFAVVATLVGVTLVLAPPASAQKTDPLKVIYESSKVVAGETLRLSGVLHLRVVHNANGTTLHINLSHNEALGLTTGTRYNANSRPQDLPILVPATPIYVSVPLSLRTSAIRPDDIPLVLNLEILLDSAGAIQSTRLVSVTDGR